jgi:hypothetical protein
MPTIAAILTLAGVGSVRQDELVTIAHAGGWAPWPSSRRSSRARSLARPRPD